MSQKLGSSLLKQASERQISSLRWVLGAALEPLKTWSALPVRFSPHDLVMGGNSWAGLFETPENLICLACQVFSLMTLSWVGSCVPAPGKQALGVGDGHGSLTYCSPWGRKDCDWPDWLKITIFYYQRNDVIWLLLHGTIHARILV